MADKPADNTNANVPDVAKQQAIAANSQVGKRRRQSSVPKRLYLAREPNVPPTNRSLASDAQQELIGKWQNREGEFGSQEQQILAQVVGLARPPNTAEAANLNAMISTPAEGSRGFEYVKFRTLSQSPTTPLPSEDLFLPGSYKEMMVSALLPEAWYQAVGDEGSYTSGDLIMIAYGDPINHLDPYVVQNTGGGEGTLADLTYADRTPSGVKTSFYKGIRNTGFPAKCIRPTRPTPGMGETWQQKGFLRGKEYIFEATMFGKHILDVRAAKAFTQMSERAAKEDVNIKITSAFRLPEEQEYFYCKYKQGTGNVAARPGYSNHQSGVAMDLNTKGAPNDKAIRRKTKISTGQGKVYEWLTKNAAKYGFRRIKIEHWHWEHIPSLNANLQKIKNSKKKET
jgi:hypothetical protein